MAGVGSKPGHKQGGRQRGTPNKITNDLRQIILGALEGLGADKYMRDIAIQQPVAFCTLLGKLLPKDVNVALPAAPEAGTKAGMIDLGRRLAFLLAVVDTDAVKKKGTRSSGPRSPAPKR